MPSPAGDYRRPPVLFGSFSCVDPGERAFRDPPGPNSVPNCNQIDSQFGPREGQKQDKKQGRHKIERRVVPWRHFLPNFSLFLASWRVTWLIFLEFWDPKRVPKWTSKSIENLTKNGDPKKFDFRWILPRFGVPREVENRVKV